MSSIRRHWREWAAVLQAERRMMTWRSWLKMARGALTPSVSPTAWRRRARVCLKCPIYDRELRRCRGPVFGGNPSGCGCYVPWLLKVRAPYPLGCWARQFGGPALGWGRG